MGPDQRNGLTVITSVASGALQPLREALDAVAREQARGDGLFQKIDNLHFARWAILERPPGGPLPAIAPTLLFATTFDGPVEAHLLRLVEHAGPWLDRVYVHCDGYPPGGAANVLDFARYLDRHRRRHHGFLVGTPGCSLQDIRREAALRTTLEGLLEQPDTQSEDPVHRHLLLRRKTEKQGLGWALEMPARPRVRGLVGKAIAAVQRSRLGSARWFPPPGILRAPLGLVRRLERPEGVPIKPQPAWLATHHQAMQRDEQEDPNRTNRLTLCSDVKPGFLRLLLLSLVLRFFDAVAAANVTGQLHGTEGIHAARWVLAHEGKRLLFLSDYDGDWGEYLSAFSRNTGVSRGVTAIWSSAATFPATRYLLCGGAAKEKAFKDAVRANQIRTQVWYDAKNDPLLTVEAINRARTLRRGLACTALRVDEAEPWLELLA